MNFITGLLFAAFVILKVLGIIYYSWWWAVLILCIPFLFGILLVILAFFISCISIILKKK